MPTDNKSPSYLQERDEVRRWLLKHPDGKMATELLKKHAGGDAARLFDDDKHVDWAELVREYQGAVVLAANCREAREAYQVAAQSSSTMAPPASDKNAWSRFMAAPLGYVLRRQIEMCDPEYWNNPANCYREALDHPEWACLPPEVLRGRLEQYLPKGTPIPMPERRIVVPFVEMPPEVA